MRWAQDAGARVHTHTKVRRIDGRDRSIADGLTVEADRIVVAAGTMHTPGLLRRSGVRHPELGRNLSIHPATAAWALMDEEVDMAKGVPQSYCVDEFADEGMLFEGVAGPPDYLAMAVPFAGDRHRELMLDYRHVAQFGLMVSDTSRGRVAQAASSATTSTAPTPPTIVTRHRAPRRAAVRRRRAAASSCPIAGVAASSTARSRCSARRRDLKLMAFHPLGTAARRRRPRRRPARSAAATTSTSATAARSRPRSASTRS